MKGISVLFGVIIGLQLFGDDFPICTEPWDDVTPGVAYGKENYLVVWRDNRHTGKTFSEDIFGQLVSVDGALIDTNFPISRIMTNEKQQQPAVASDGNNFLVVWQLRPYTIRQYDIYGQFVSDSGMLIDTNFPICTKPDTQCFCGVAYAGTTYLVVWTEEEYLWGPLYGQIVSRKGALIEGNFPVFTGSGNYSAVIGGDTSFLVVWENGDVYGQLVSPSGNLIGNNFAISTAQDRQGHPDGAWDGEKYLVVWQDARNGGWDIYGQFVSANGGLIDTNFLIASPGGWRPVAEWDGRSQSSG